MLRGATSPANPIASQAQAAISRVSMGRKGDMSDRDYRDSGITAIGKSALAAWRSSRQNTIFIITISTAMNRMVMMPPARMKSPTR
jgi:hypothetical protein